MPDNPNSYMPQHTAQRKNMSDQPRPSFHPGSPPTPTPHLLLISEDYQMPQPTDISPTSRPTTPGPPLLSGEATPNLTLPEPDKEQLEVEEQLSDIIEEIKHMKLEDRPPLSKVQAYGRAKDLIKKVNIALHRLVPESAPLTELNQVTYAAALYVNRCIFPHYHQSLIKSRKKKKIPSWKLKLDKQLYYHRKHLSQIKQFTSAPKTQGKLKNKIIRLCAKLRCNLEDLQNIARELEEKILALSKRIRKQTNKYRAKIDNRLFKNNPRLFYRNLIHKNINVEKPPSPTKLEEYWKPLFETEVVHNQEARWIEDIKELNKTKPQMPEPKITTGDIISKLKKFANYKKPGIDSIPNFWLKQLTALHGHYSICFNRMLKGEEATPSWLTRGQTSLIPKSDETQKPEKYRPICCLNTTYKLFTSLLADFIQDHLTTGGFLDKEQAGCKRRCFGTKDQLLINKSIMEDCRKRKRNLSQVQGDLLCFTLIIVSQ